MANSRYVSYISMSKQAKQIREYAMRFNNELVKAYTVIKNMHKNWTGDRYNDLAKRFNNLSGTVNKFTKEMVDKTPYVLEQISNYFSQADGVGNVTTVQRTNIKKMPTLKIYRNEKLKFFDKEIKIQEKEFSKHMIYAKEHLNNLEKACKNITWQTRGTDLFYDRFLTMKRKISEEINQINTSCKKTIEEVIQQMNTAERKNMQKKGG